MLRLSDKHVSASSRRSTVRLVTSVHRFSPALRPRPGTPFLSPDGRFDRRVRYVGQYGGHAEKLSAVLLKVVFEKRVASHHNIPKDDPGGGVYHLIRSKSFKVECMTSGH